MAYDKYTWQTGEVITQEKLNHMEDGIEDAYELPAVSASDNGKVLGVENGQFGLVNGGGGSDGIIVVDMSGTTLSDSDWDLLQSEDVYNSNTPTFANFGNYMTGRLIEVSLSMSGATFTFEESHFGGSTTAVYVTRKQVDKSKSISTRSYTIYFMTQGS